MTDRSDRSDQSASQPSPPPEMAPPAVVIHQLLAQLPRKAFPVSRRDVPPDGIYVLYEAGETFEFDGETFERIVGVGTHSGEGRLARRLGIHASGDRRGSDLRLNLGGAVLARDGASADDRRAWAANLRSPMREAEEAVTADIRARFAVRCIGVPSNDERQALAGSLEATLARTPVAEPSEGWLGRQAPLADIRATGLWIVPSPLAQTLSQAQVARIEALVTAQVSAPVSDQT